MMGIYMICDPYVSCILNPLQLCFRRHRRRYYQTAQPQECCISISLKPTLKRLKQQKGYAFVQKNCTHIKEEAELNVLLVVVNSNDLFPPKGYCYSLCILLTVGRIEIALKSHQMMGTGFFNVPPSGPCSHPNPQEHTFHCMNS